MLTFLVTGASRGIGMGLVKHLLKLPRSRVIATCRGSTDVFHDLIEEYKDRIIVSMLDVTSEWGYEVLKAQLAEKSIFAIDVLIANAGIAGERDTFQECQPDNFNEIFGTNVFGTMLTYQNLSPLVLNSNTKIFVTMSSAMGSIAKTGEGYPQRTGSYAVPKICASYRMSKCTANMLSMILSRDPEIKEGGCKVLCINPGWVQTDMGGAGGRQATFSVAECAENIIDILNRAIAIQEDSVAPVTVFTSIPKETTNSKIAATSSETERERKEFEEYLLAGNNCVFVNYDGSVIPW